MIIPSFSDFADVNGMMETDKKPARSFRAPRGLFAFQATSPVYCFMLIRNRMLIE